MSIKKDKKNILRRVLNRFRARLQKLKSKGHIADIPESSYLSIKSKLEKNKMDKMLREMEGSMRYRKEPIRRTELKKATKERRIGTYSQREWLREQEKALGIKALT